MYLNYLVHLTAYLNGSDHAEYTIKSQLTEHEVNTMKIRKVHTDRNTYASYWERMEANAQ